MLALAVVGEIRPSCVDSVIGAVLLVGSSIRGRGASRGGGGGGAAGGSWRAGSTTSVSSSTSSSSWRSAPGAGRPAASGGAGELPPSSSAMMRRMEERISSIDGSWFLLDSDIGSFPARHVHTTRPEERT